MRLWPFSGGYPALLDCMDKLRNSKDGLEFQKEPSQMLLPRVSPNTDKLRTYKLKPGTMV